ncbi:MAG: sensor histidine kinase [Acidobacteriota bacterium]
MSPRPPPREDERTPRPDDVVREETPAPHLAKGTHDDVTAQARAAMAGEIREDVVAIAHDLKNPLAIIMMEAGLLEQRLATRSPAVQRGLEHIARNAAYVDRLISDLLDLASEQAGALALQFERIDLARLVGDTVARCVSTFERGRVQVEIRDVVVVHGDGSRLERVLANLVTNALKHSPQHAAVTVRLDLRGTRAHVSVIDNGPGLPADEARRVFQRFYRGRAGSRGYGLGLYICRRIVENHGGRIGVHSDPGRGARFFFDLPAVT